MQVFTKIFILSNLTEKLASIFAKLPEDLLNTVKVFQLSKIVNFKVSTEILKSLLNIFGLFITIKKLLNNYTKVFKGLNTSKIFNLLKDLLTPLKSLQPGKL